MPKINIHTTLAFCPKPKKHEITVITRGATAVLDFDLYNKVYDFNDIEQLSVLFAQGREIFKYDMVEYFALTEDAMQTEGKIYYTRVASNVRTSKYKFEPTVGHLGGNTDELYDKIELLELEQPDPENWQINRHFSVSDDGKWITFMLTANETVQFKVTDCLSIETAIRLNTDEAFKQGVDSTLIDDYHRIVVKDSLMAKYIETTDFSSYEPVNPAYPKEKYTAGKGIRINQSNTISIDTDIVAEKSDIPEVIWEKGAGEESVQQKGTGAVASGKYSVAEGYATVA